MPYLTLANPAKRRRKKKSRRSPAQKRALRKMLAANKAASTPKRRKTRRKTRRTARRTRRSISKTPTPMAKKSRKRSTRRRARRSTVTTTSTTRKTTRRNPAGGSIMSQLKNSFSKENLMLAGGVVLGNVATNYLLKMDFAKKLPGMDGASAAMAKTAYSTLIPVVVAAVTYRYNRPLAQGMVIGALSNAVIGLVSQNSASLPPEITANIAPPALTAQVGGFRSVRGTRGLRALPLTLAAHRGMKAYPTSGLNAYPNARMGGLRNVYSSPSPFNSDAFAKG